MLGEYLFNESSAMYCTSVLLVDHGVESRAEYAYAFKRRGFTVVRWEDDLAFRIGWEDALKAGEKLAVIASDDAYVPYDLAQLMQRYDVSLGGLFPKLDTATLGAADGLDLDFLAVAFKDFYREHPDFAGAPDGSGARVNPSVAELTDHLSSNGLKALSDVQSETSRAANTVMYSMGTPRIFMLLGCAFVSGVSGMFAGTSIFTEAGGCASLTQILIRYEGFTWLGIMAPIANLLSVVYAVAAAAVLIINQRRLQSIRTTASDGKRQIDILRIFLVVYCLITLPLSPVRAVGMVLAWYLLIDANIPTNRINLPMMRLYHHVLGLGKYLKDYSDLSERGTTRDAQLYGWNLAYAVALGLAKGELASVDRVVWKLSGSTAQSEPVGRHASASSKEPDPFDNLRRLGIPINITTEELSHKIDNVVVQTAEKHGIKAAAYNSDREAYAALVSEATEPRPDDNMAQKSVRAYVRWLNEELEKRDHDES